MPIPTRASESNPQPLPEDLILPMPGGGEMVFRPVFLDVGDALTARREFRMGDRSGEHAKERVSKTSIGGSFVAPRGGRPDTLFYIGKYEVTRGQIAAVNALQDAAKGDASMSDEPRLPAVNLTRLEIENFIAAYMQWLLVNARDQLPKRDASTGLLRLPSEEEWEFAARGGIAVPEDVFEKKTPYTQPIVKHEWFAGPRSSHGKLKPIGNLDPNPLGLHDMLGNAAELTSSRYRLDPTRGSAGSSFTVRGGDYRSTDSGLRSSQRTELPDFADDGSPGRSEAIGFRLVISAPIITNANIRELEKGMAKESFAMEALPAVAQQFQTALAQRRAMLDAERASRRPGANGQPLEKGTRVRVIRAEPLRFRGTVFRQAVPGELFPVALHDIRGAQVFVLTTDAENKPIGLSIAQDAVEIVPINAESVFSEALEALAQAPYPNKNALTLLSKACEMRIEDPAATRLQACVTMYAQVSGELARANQAMPLAVAESRRLRKNANISDRINPLTGDDDGRRRAATDRYNAKQVEENARLAIEQAKESLAAALDALAQLAREQLDDGSFDVVVAIDRFLTGCGHRLARSNAFLRTGGNSDLLAKLPGLISKADAASREAEAALALRDLVRCRSTVEEGLAAMPAHRKLKQLQTALAPDLELIPQAIEAITTLQKSEQAKAALVIAQSTQEFCRDDTALNELASQLIVEAAE